MKRGSALLIVLGMLAFVVASAVAFSVYMRYARMPSSYLRRTSSSRLLVKAALAEAIDIVDNAVGNSHYAGQTGRQQVKNYKRITDEMNLPDVVDYWQDHCFIGSNRLVSADTTVATLCTEALAYIPPPLINEVRYYSRRSIAGQWHTLGFDSGRFAFTAVDVSDYFDVNSVRGNPVDAQGNVLYGRNSSDRGRITLSHAFENAQHTGYAYDPDDWDEFMDNYLGSDKMPLVSLADMSLAMNKQGMPSKMNPFCNYILNGANFVQSETGSDAELLRNMTFVTDSWFAPTNRPVGSDISRGSNQPFQGSEKGATLDQIYNVSTKFLTHLQSRNTPLYKDPEIFQLYDYLDEDSVPLSLAMPTVERTPMIIGVDLEGGLEVAVSQPAGNPEVRRTSNPGTPGVDFEFSKSVSTLMLRGTLKVSAGVVFPFKYKRPTDGNFKAQAALTVTFVPSDYEKLRRSAPKTVVVWGNSRQTPQVEKLTDIPAYVTALSEMKSLTLPSMDVCTEEEDAVLSDQSFAFDFTGGVAFKTSLPAASGLPYTTPDDCSVRIVRKYNLVPNPNGGDPLRGTEVPGSALKECGWLPVNANLDNVIAQNDLLSGTGKYYPVVQVWVRIVNDNNKTVDLSPAYWEDDALTGGSAWQKLRDGAKSSAERPLLRFHATAVANSEVSFDANADKLTVGSGGQATISDFSPKAYLADDPRFNFAPEDMMAQAQVGTSIKADWLKEKRSGASDRDGDIFMATSDAGYLQSVYELAHIGMTSAGSNDKFGVLNAAGYDGEATTSFADTPANAAMWKTYSQYDSGSGQGYLDRLGIVNGTSGFRVNPYTSSRNIFMAALANTPLDWWAASTNMTVNAKVHNAPETAEKYSFSEWSGAMVQLKYETLKKVADAMMAKFRDPNLSGSWSTAFDDFDWDDDPERLLGVDMGSAATDPKFHSVDRKFLYGFWKECFADRQQLYLIFVRAEPMMMGGGGLGQTPPQLGARAVALVWRDPTATKSDVSGTNTGGGPRPHRTRVLFYRQFD